MSVQVLISTMNQNDHSILEKMNIQSSAIVVNQCDHNLIEEFEFKGKPIKFLSFKERGVGLSRNNALMRADADICIFADEDVKYEDDYETNILNAFEQNPKADVILFNVLSTNPERPSSVISGVKKVKRYNCLKYGTVRIAVKTEKLKQANIYFSLLFGGGAKYSCGEDSLFLFECINKGLEVYTYPQIIGYVSHEESSWFYGYNDKYFIDKGILHYCLTNRWAKLLSLQFVIRHRKMFKDEKNWIEAYRLMISGITQVQSLK